MFAGLLPLFVGLVAPVYGALTATELKVNGLDGTDLPNAPFPAAATLVFTWTPTSRMTSSLFAAQTGFELQVADERSAFPSSSSDAGGANITAGSAGRVSWSSGMIDSDEPHYQLPGTMPALSADTTYKCRVRLATAQEDLDADWSAVSYFDTAPNESEWSSAQWIGGGSEVRTDWTLPTSPIIRARAYASGVGVFELHINGAKVGDHFLDPGEAVYDQKVLFVGFNVTQLLRSGTNAIGARLGNSKWGYLDIYANRTAVGDQSGDSTRAFIMLLKLQLADGTEMTLKTTSGSTSSLSSNPSWSSRHGPIVYDHLWHGEIYDARQELGSAVGATAGASAGTAERGATHLGAHAWDAPVPMSEYPAGTWSTAAAAMAPKVGRMYPQLMPPIRILTDFQPVATSPEGQGTTLFDFGQNMAGIVTMTLTPKSSSSSRNPGFRAGAGAGSTLYIRLQHTEIRNAAGGACNNYYPGMEFGHASKTCSMTDWYQRKWYECANQTDGYVFTVPQDAAAVAAAGVLTYAPTFTYHGFRFVSLTVAEVSANADGTETERFLHADEIAALPYTVTMVAHRMHSDVKPLTTLSIQQPPAAPAGVAATGKLLSQIYNATMASHISQLYSIPTDCPQREKRGWMQDAGISSSSLQTFYDSFAFHANFIRLIADNQKKGCTNQPSTSIYKPCHHSGPESSAAWFNGSVPDVTPFPTGPYGGNPGTTDWQVAYVMIARNMVLHYGAVTHPVLTELWPSLDLFMDYLDRLTDPKTGLLLQGARGDWIPPQGQLFHTPATSIAAFFHTLSVGYMAEIATAIGKTADAARYTARYAANQKAYHTQFYNGNAESDVDGFPKTRCCYDSGSQTSNVMALHLNVAPSAAITEKTVAMLVASIYDHAAVAPNSSSSGGNVAAPDPFGAGPHVDVGITGTTYIFEVLHAHAHDAVAFELLNVTTYPSLGRMITQEATTLWESWDGDEGTMCDSGSSRNHIMFGGGVNRFLQASVGGLTIDTRPGVGLLSNSSGGVVGAGSRSNGWQRLLVHPSPAAIRTLVQGGTSRKTPRGVAKVSWTCGSDRSDSAAAAAAAGASDAKQMFEMNVTVPPGAVASVKLPLAIVGGVSATNAAGSAAAAVLARVGESDVCVLSCSDTSLVGTASCVHAGIVTAECSHRLDGEPIMSLEVVHGGDYSFAVVVSTGEEQ